LSDLATAFGLMLVMEGLLWGGFPAAARRMAEEASKAPDGLLRGIGLAAMAVGVFTVWLARN
jgi:uncharacterized protein YjeT (DUF2065 family)